ncbi:MAG: hypothetical protein WCY80_03710 [Candidatus Izemoplasmatales bacterium]|jgi:hypothetical protein|nr:hypothetical protein [Acholeplasmataceae bacterium]
MKNKIINALFILSLIILVPIGIWGLIYEYFIFDKSIIPSQVYNITMIIGYSSLFGLILSVLLDKLVSKTYEKNKK